jgi:hypothetical protein
VVYETLTLKGESLASESCNYENLQNLLGDVHAPVILDAR